MGRILNTPKLTAANDTIYLYLDKYGNTYDLTKYTNGNILVVAPTKATLIVSPDGTNTFTEGHIIWDGPYDGKSFDEVDLLEVVKYGEKERNKNYPGLVKRTVRKWLKDLLGFEQGGIIDYASYLKSGGHIKEKNKGKFTKSAKAAGEGVLEHARKVVNNPSSSETQRKRALFALNSKKWSKKKKHEEGGVIKYSNYLS